MQKDNKELASKIHWDAVNAKNSTIWNALSNCWLLRSYYHFSLFHFLDKIFKDAKFKTSEKKLIEIGCAPGNYLVKFNKEFGFNVFGIEYSKDGYGKTIKNLKQYGIATDDIFLEDFFNDDFIDEREDSFDVVFSGGFIEHFDDPKKIIMRQLKLLNNGGYLICVIPNVKNINAFIASDELIKKHNTEIMDLEVFRGLFKNLNVQIEMCDYFGGIFNAGLFNKKNKFFKYLLVCILFLQRITLDNLQKVLFLCFGADFSNKYSSPSLLCIAKKK